MCIIIDANFASEIFGDSKNVNNIPIISWLYDANKDGIVIYGGRLAKELFIMATVRQSLVTLSRAGRAIRLPDDEIDSQEQTLVGMRVCKSDDQHVIAIAQISGARTLCSHDKALHEDFKNKALVDQPKGSIYQDASHSGLLRHTPSCKKHK